MRERRVALKSPALDGLDAAVEALEGEEELNGLFEYRLEVVIQDSHAAPERAAQLLEAPISLRFDDAGVEVRSVHGIVRNVEYQHDGEHARARLSLTVVPRTWLLTQRYGAEIYLEASIPEVLGRKLDAIGLSQGTDYLLALRESYPVREIVVQYEESDYDFFSRWCEHEGIVTFYEHRDGRDILVLGDTRPPYPTLSPAVLMQRGRREHPSAYDVRTTLCRLPAHTRVHDYNYRSPRLGLDHVQRVERHVSTGDWVEYGAHTQDPRETQRIALVRGQETASRHEKVHGSSTELALRAGSTFTLSGGAHDDRKLLVTRVVCRGRTAEDPSATSWDNHFVAIPLEVPFRPERRTPRPRVSGFLNARVDGEIKGHYAELDEAGRYHVQLALDRSGRTDLSASHPVRMMQPHAGSFYGMHFPLRPGTEVLVGFVDGNPDRPIIIGTAPNPETSSPVVRANQTQNVIRTGSSNEMVIEDKHGIERIRIHTPKEQTTLQLGSIEEPEQGALLTTEASISHASRLSNNVATRRATMLTSSTSQIVGDSAYVLTGLNGVARAADRGLELPASVDIMAIARSLSELSAHPDAYGGHDDDDSFEDDAEEQPSHVGAGGLWSEIGESLHSMVENSSFDAVRAMAEATDTIAARALGRAQGEALGAPLKPAFISGSPGTSAMFGRDSALVYADRLAALSSHDTATVIGRQHAELKSPNSVELAGGERVYMTSAGVLDMSANTIRVVGGYYPELEAPALDDGTSVGVMSRRDLRFVSVDDCILLCAQKNLIGSAHTGDIRFQADGTISMTSASIVGSAGSISLDAGGDITIRAGASVTIKGADVHIVADGAVTVDASVLKVNCSTEIDGDLTVSGIVDCAKLNA